MKNKGQDKSRDKCWRSMDMPGYPFIIPERYPNKSRKISLYPKKMSLHLHNEEHLGISWDILGFRYLFGMSSQMFCIPGICASNTWNQGFLILGVARKVGNLNLDSLWQWFIYLVLLYHLIETLGRRLLEKL